VSVNNLCFNHFTTSAGYFYWERFIIHNSGSILYFFIFHGNNFSNVIFAHTHTHVKKYMRESFFLFKVSEWIEVLKRYSHTR
jgi:hypothetical protein